MSVHRRKTSRDSDEPSPTSPTSPTILTNGTASGTQLLASRPAPPPPISRRRSPSLQSVPPSPFRNTHVFSNSTSVNPPISPSTSTPHHKRTPSVVSIPIESLPQRARLGSHARAPSIANGTPPISGVPAGAKRHTRIHSRNLSIFFPRPGASPSHASIAEDGVQEVDIPAPSSVIPSSSSSPAETSAGRKPGLGEGFVFGGGSSRVSEGSVSMAGKVDPSSMTTAKRKGHHHKHSLSHNFFSFMDPTAQAPKSFSPSPSHINTAFPSSPFPATPPPKSPPPPPSLWDTLASPNAAQTPVALPAPSQTQAKPVTLAFASASTISTSRQLPAVFTVTQFLIGASMWAEGQRRGTLACTGLGYWIVFDAWGVGIRWWMGKAVGKSDNPVRRPFGVQRIETTALFAQSIYLIFSSVYVLKEALEHILLSSGSSSPDHDGHHKHRGDENLFGIAFPTTLLWLSLFSLLFSSLTFRNHSKLLDATGTAVPIPRFRFLRTMHVRYQRYLYIVKNPFNLFPITYTLALLVTSHLFPAAMHSSADLLLSTLETSLTFVIAYPAAVSLGKVLLQTAPDRGVAQGGQTESFQRAIREIKRHPEVLHIPSPHLWQVSPPSSTAGEARLVATIELHVKPELDDDSIIELTQWAWERCSTSMGKSSCEEVSVSVVRG